MGGAGSRGLEWAGKPLVKTTCASKRRGPGLRNSHGGGQARDGRADGGEGSWLVAVYGQCNSISRGGVRRGGQGRAKQFEIRALI